MDIIDHAGQDEIMNNVAPIQPGTSIVPTTPMEMLNNAVASGASMDVLEKLMSLQERWEANQARKAFDVAMANAQADLPVIVRTRLVEYGEGSKKTTYRHEELAEIIRLVAPTLKSHGLAFRFRTEQLEGGQVRVTCIVTGHGHREETSLQSSRDSSGGKNDIQAIGSVVTYLERYTLKAALGLAASNDDDGKAVGDAEVGGFITDPQVGEINKLIEETGTSAQRFCGYMKVETIADIPTKQFQRAIDALNAKKAQS